MIQCVVSSRQVDETCTDDYASLVTVFNVLSQVQQLAGPEALIRRFSTTGAILFKIIRS